MGLRQRSQEQSLLNFFREKTVVTLEELMTFSHLSSRSVKRRLYSWKVYSSYNHRGRYYVFSEICKFNSNGIWTFRGIYFSKHGNLKQTIVHFVNQSESGLGDKELEPLLNISVKKALSRYFKDDSQLKRELENGSL